MASLRERNGRYYIVFTRRLDSELEQKVKALRTDSKRQAKRLKFELEEKAERGEFDPFGPWDLRDVLDGLKRRSRSGMSLEDVGRKFLESRSHVSAATRQNYERRLERLKSSIGATMPVRLIEVGDVRSFCFQTHLSRASQRTYLRFCKMLFGWMADERYVDESPAAGIRYPRKKDKISGKTISESQLIELFDAHKSVQRAKIQKGQRRGLHVWFRPLAAFAFYTGMRRGEILRLTWDNVDFEQEFIGVTDTKPGRERVVPMQEHLIPHLAAWHRLHGRPTSGLVFFKKRMGDRQIPLYADHVTQVFKKYVRAADLPDTVNFHGLRHSCATYLLRRGLDLAVVSKILGHAGPTTTMIYEHLNATDLKRRMRELGL